MLVLYYISFHPYLNIPTLTTLTQKYTQKKQKTRPQFSLTPIHSFYDKQKKIMGTCIQGIKSELDISSGYFATL